MTETASPIASIAANKAEFGVVSNDDPEACIAGLDRDAPGGAGCTS